MTQIKEIRGDLTATGKFNGTAAGAAAETVVFRAPYAVTVTAVRWVPDAAVTANGTNFATLSVTNRGQAGAGAAIPASRAYSATNSVKAVPEVMTPSGSAADLQLAAGDVLTLVVAHSGSGLAVPAGQVEITYRGR